jgi:hypothetical protein
MSKKKKTQTSQVVKSTKIETWDCKCGKKKITSPFCPNCGKKCTTGAVPTDGAPKRLSKGALIAIIATSIVLVAALIVGVVFMTKPAERNEEKATILSFAQATSLETMKTLDGKKVTIMGYMSTLSPVNGEFMYLMNLPYQSCPFCIPNTTTLSNTLAVYAETGKSFEFTDRAIQVTGILEFGSWTDEFGYQYEYRIKDASFVVLDNDNLSAELRLWQELASEGLVMEVYSLMSSVSALCYWPEYLTTVDDQTVYVQPEDVAPLLEVGGYYYDIINDMYYDDLIIRIKEIDANAFGELISLIREIQAFSKTVHTAFVNKEYSLVPEYTNAFMDGRTQYKYNNYDAFNNQYEALWIKFSNWMNKWEV